MKARLPILIIIPHGGQAVPDELSGYEQIDRFGIFIESDTCANELFAFEDVVAKIDTYISRLFVDLDRSPLMIPPVSSDGVIKKETLCGRRIFKEGVFPDEIAITNILKRYYLPFHETIAKIIDSGELKLIIECHTMMPVGPRNSFDAGRPRPLITVENIINRNGDSLLTCPIELARSFITVLNKRFNNEDNTIAGRLSLNKQRSMGYILEKYGLGEIPMLRLSISRSLFLNDNYFNYDYLEVDALRIDELKEKIWSAIDKFVSKHL